ncbi:MAG TPA: hypothetical protein VFJ30_03220 [Phycisphaerae bacterium]|nr:hypothetical protein [Phycisphaerae bacterium]
MATLEAGGVKVAVDARAGVVRSIRAGKPAVQIPGPAPAGMLEVADLRAGRTYTPLADAFTVSGRKESKARGRQSFSFTQQYEGAPFSIVHTIRQTKAGIRWEASLRLDPGEQENRSLRVTWVFPAPTGWRFWAPQDTTPLVHDGVTPRRYVYGHTSFRPYGTMIPLCGLWNDRAALAVWSPPDIQKPNMSFELDTLSSGGAVTGIDRGFDDASHLKVVYHHVGLRPGKVLKLAVCLAGAEPGWRCVLGRYVQSYPELFEPAPATRKVEGMYGISTPTRLPTGHFERMKKAGVTFMEMHGHFPEYSVFIRPEALKDKSVTWRCKPHPGKMLTLADNRHWIRQLNKAGIAPFMYWYNVHANRRTISRLWPDDLMRDEQGRIMLKWKQEPSIRAAADSPFGRHLIEQIKLLLKAYPEMAGLFVDNYAVERYDFAHDDGVTMIHNRPAWDMNRNHQTVGPPCFEIAHKAGKIIMVNKISTIESLRGADMVLAETRGVESVRKHAMACVFRALFPLKMELPEGPHGAERGIQHLLLNGCFPDEALYWEAPATMAAYRPLTDAMIGKRWVLEPDPLDVPAGLDGQIFRIDRAAPGGGTVVVALVDFQRSWQDGRRTEGLKVTVRLSDAARYKRASWLGVERSAGRAAACKLTRRGKALTVGLPAVGAAGILRLSR